MQRANVLLIVAVLVSTSVHLAVAQSNKNFPKGLHIYCKEENCYDVLQIPQTASEAEIKKAYRRLSLLNHPDKSDHPDAAERFMIIARANEVLSNKRTRKAYDDFLANPGRHVWQHYSNYYQAYYAPKSDLRLVVMGIVLAISAIQYASISHKISRVSSHILSEEKTKNQVSKRAQELAGRQLNLKKQKDYEVFLKLEKVAQQEVLDKVIFGKINVGAGVMLRDLLIFKIFLLPLDILNWSVFQSRWLWKFTILRQERESGSRAKQSNALSPYPYQNFCDSSTYGKAEREYLTRKALQKRLNVDTYEGFDEDQKEKILSKELWVPANMDAYSTELFSDVRAQGKARR